MEVIIIKHDGRKELDRKVYPILKYKPIFSSQSLLMVKVGQMGIDDSDFPYYEISKVQYLAYGDIDLENNVLMAFYLDEYAGIGVKIIDELPSGYYQEGNRCLLVDYKSYLEICEMTGETVLALGDYISYVKAEKLGPNSFLEFDGKLLNNDQQNQKF